jgi:GTPase SAR1 family protein
VHAAAICFSLNNYDSFDDLSKWIQEVRSHNSIAKVFLVGCKGDIESVVSDEKALKFA